MATARNLDSEVSLVWTHSTLNAPLRMYMPLISDFAALWRNLALSAIVIVKSKRRW